MKNYLSSAIRDSKVFQEIYRVQGIEIDILDSSIRELDEQLNIDKATWSLPIYEKELGISIDSNKNIDERRSVIKSKWRGTGKLDDEMIKRVVDSFTGGEVEILFDGRIIVQFTGSYGTPPNMEDVFSAVDDIKPAHLAVLYYYMYLFIKDIHNKMTIEELEKTKLDKFAF